MRKLGRKILSLIMSLSLIATTFSPVMVSAEGYTITFTFAEGYSGTTDGGDGSNIVINGSYTELRTNKDDGNTRVGAANCSNDTCTINVADGTPTYLVSGQFTFKDGDNEFDLNNAITSNITLHVQAQQQNQQPPANNNYNVTFTGTVNEGNVTYTIGDATVTASVTGKSIPASKVLEVSSTDEITLSGFDADTMQVRIVDNTPENPNQPFGMNLTVTNNKVYIVNPNGGIPTNLNFTIEAKSNNEQNNNNQQNNNPNFDGKAYLIWSCGNGICYHHYTNIPNFDDGNSYFIKESTVTADNNPGQTFSINAKYKGWSTDAKFNNWVAAYKTYKNIDENDDIDWSTVKPEDMIGDPIDVRQYEDQAIAAGTCTKNNTPQDVFEACVNNYAASQGVWVTRAQLQPLGEPDDNNAYVSYGDRNFKVVVYNDDYKGVTIGNLSDLNYYPAEWANAFLRQDQFDISATTKAKPTTINTVLLESTVNIKELNYNGFTISKIEALDVPSNAVSINKVNGEWKLVFASNFYDNVTFKVTDSNGEVSYFNVKRYTVDAWINNVENAPHLYAELYFDRTKSYTDFELTAKIEYKDGTVENVPLTHYNKVDDGLGNISEVNEEDLENPTYGPAGKGLKKSVFIYKLPNGKTDRDIKKAYVNVEYKGSTSTKYAGAFAGSGKGVLANIYHGEED